MNCMQKNRINLKILIIKLLSFINEIELYRERRKKKTLSIQLTMNTQKITQNTAIKSKKLHTITKQYIQNTI